MMTAGGRWRLASLAIVVAGAMASPRADAPAVTDIVHGYADAEMENAAVLRQYSYRGQSVQQLLAKNGQNDGKPTSETWDVAPLAGRPYRRLVMRNGKPLSQKDEHAEEARQASAVARRQGGDPLPSAGPPRHGFGMELEFDPAVIATMYQFEVVGEEVMAGRPAYVLEGRALPGEAAPAPGSEDYRRYRIKLWIDREEFSAARTEMEVVEDGARLKKGSTIATIEARLAPHVWVPQSVAVRFDATFIKIDRVRGTVSVTYSDYRRN